MGLFGKKETKQEKAQRELQEFVQKYNLQNINPSDLAIIKRIAGDLAGNGFLKVGMALSFAKAEEQAKVTYLSALVEQNWMIMNQLSRLNSNLEKLLNK